MTAVDPCNSFRDHPGHPVTLATFRTPINWDIGVLTVEALVLNSLLRYCNAQSQRYSTCLRTVAPR